MLTRAWRAWLGGRADPGERDPLGSALGHLERQVMDIVWRNDRVSVRDVRAQLSRAVAYTTVMTTLDRLFKKGLLERVREGRAFVYRSTHTRQDVEAAVASGILRRLLESGAGGTRPVLSNLVDVISDRDTTLLDDLEELVREKRRRQSRQG